MLSPAVRSLAQALEADPFYRAITSSQGIDACRRRQKLIEYFSYSLEEADVLGRTVYLDDRTLGASAWLLPADQDTQEAASSRKHEFLVSCLGKKNSEPINSHMDGRAIGSLRGGSMLSLDRRSRTACARPRSGSKVADSNIGRGGCNRCSLLFGDP